MLGLMKQIQVYGTAVKLANVKPFQGEITPNRHVVGELTKDHLRLSGLMDRYSKEYRSAYGEAEAKLELIDSRKEAEEELEHLNRRLFGLKAKYELVLSMFWAALRYDFADSIPTDAHGVGVAQNQVFWEEKEKTEGCQCPTCTSKGGVVSEVLPAILIAAALRESLSGLGEGPEESE